MPSVRSSARLSDLHAFAGAACVDHLPVGRAIHRPLRWAEIGSQLKGVSKQPANDIRNLQPFDSGHHGDPRFHPLALINDANNVSKYQLLPVAILHPVVAEYKIDGLEVD
jgi:hypothetical protein